MTRPGRRPTADRGQRAAGSGQRTADGTGMTGTRMRPIARTIPLDEARAIIERTIRPIERVERVLAAVAQKA